MKRIYIYLLSAIVSLAFAPAVTAQTITQVIGEELTFKSSGYTINNNVGISKQVSSPMTDGSGRYWIKLEAFATGEASFVTSSTPSDVILVLDVSSSMEETYTYTDKDGVSHSGTRLEALKDAATLFVKNIYDNAVASKNVDPNYDGNRIAIVSFGGKDSSTPVSVDAGWTDVQTNISKEGDNYSGSLLTTISDLDYKKGTRTDTALQYAYELLDGTRGTARSNANVTVVVFTDGCPSTQGSTSFTASYANNAIYYAHQIKASSFGLSRKVYSIGLISSSTQDYYYKVIKFLNLISSNYPNSSINQNVTTGWTVNNGTVTWPGQDGSDATPEGTYYQLVNANTDLSSIFDSISQQAGGAANTELTAASTTTVDVVSASFLLPTNAQSSDIKVFTAKCTGADPYTFATEVQAGHDNTTDVDDNIGVELGKDANNNDKISVTGFDYSHNWCGPIKNASGTITGYQGYKIIIMIPIIANPDAVGGPNVVTNAPESGIYVDGQTTPLIPFEYPTVSLPVNIYIEKAGLKKGESAKFIIEKAVLPDSGDPADVADNAWSYVTSVFVTKPQLDETANNPVVKIKGLPASELVGEVQKGLVYRIREEGWSWSYTYSTDPKYTVSGQVNNPFEFTNTPKENIDIRVRHAESKATNVFKTGGGFTYDDSKTNVRP